MVKKLEQALYKRFWTYSKETNEKLFKSLLSEKCKLESQCNNATLPQG